MQWPRRKWWKWILGKKYLHPDSCGFQNRYVMCGDGQWHQGWEDAQLVGGAGVVRWWVEEGDEEGVPGGCVHHLAQVLAKFTHHHQLLHWAYSLVGGCQRRRSFSIGLGQNMQSWALLQALLQTTNSTMAEVCICVWICVCGKITAKWQICVGRHTSTNAKIPASHVVKCNTSLLSSICLLAAWQLPTLII